MKNQHTPGPWKDQNTAIVGVRPGDSGLPLMVAQVVLPIHFDAGQKDYEAMRANARLIAAAPELLAALEECVRCMTHAGGAEQMDADEAAVDTARAAIAKAKGK